MSNQLEAFEQKIPALLALRIWMRLAYAAKTRRIRGTEFAAIEVVPWGGYHRAFGSTSGNVYGWTVGTTAQAETAP